jgi:hypothetical protein
MKQQTLARIAGFTFLFYIAVAFPTFLLDARATQGHDTATRLASIAAHVPDLRWSIVLTILCCFSALVLAITLYGLIRDGDSVLAVTTLLGRTCEAVLGMLGIPRALQLIALATPGSAPEWNDPLIAETLTSYLVMPGQDAMLGAPFFAIGSLAFSVQALRVRLIPRTLAVVGVVASILLLVALPFKLAGLIQGPVAERIWLPMLFFEVPLGFWFLVRGVRAPLPSTSRRVDA